MLEEAAAVYRQVLHLDPENADRQFWLENFYEEQEYLEEAMHQYREACKLEDYQFYVYFPTCALAKLDNKLGFPQLLLDFLSRHP